MKENKQAGIVKKGIEALRSRWSNLRMTQNRIPYPVILGILALALILEIAFVGLLLHLGILPGQYMLLIIVILVAIDLGLFVLVTNSSRGRKRFFTGMILTVLLMIMLLPMTYFLNNTGDALQRIAGSGEQWEEYDVIALKEGSSYTSIDDLKEKSIYALDSQSKMNVEAQEKLVTTADVSFKTESDIMSLANLLQDSQGQLHDEVIFVSKSAYNLQCEEIENFKKNTTVIYSMDVMKRSAGNSNRINVTEDPFNVYITGIDTWGNIDKVSRSDVNMIVTINPQTRQILLTSIPRDAYVQLHSFGQMDKLTHSGIYGVDETLDTVHDWLGVDLNYYVKINFSMVVRLIGAIGGIDVYSDKEFDSSVSKYHYEKGWNHMHGKKALFFARERKSFEKGDAERIKNQQKVMQALIRKITSSKVILTSYTEILEIVSENMTTNLSQRDMAALARMQLRDMDTKWKVRTIRIECDESSGGTYSMGMGRELFIVLPQEDSVEKAKQEIHDVMYPVDSEKPDADDLLKDITKSTGEQ